MLFIAFGGMLIYVSTDLIADLTTNTITKDPAALGIDISNIVMDDSIKNIALFGVDARDNEFTGQSDAIMILTVDNKHQMCIRDSFLLDGRENLFLENRMMFPLLSHA